MPDLHATNVYVIHTWFQFINILEFKNCWIHSKIGLKFYFVNTGLSLAQILNIILTISHIHIQATGKQHWCEGVALLLHYLHLVACCWLFSIGVLAYRRLTEGPRRSGLRLHCTLAWLLPASLVMVRNWI
jgi:hypothetical protein